MPNLPFQFSHYHYTTSKQNPTKFSEKSYWEICKKRKEAKEKNIYSS